jgi:lipid A ethanolaminephosphotransferase
LDEHDSLIVLHEIGSHGPTYFRRYPDDHREFNPDCPRSDIQNCDQTALINTYDNTILYSDYINSKIIELASSFSDRAVSVMYVSDHGESLGDAGVYLHGLPYSFAPREQTHVPMWLWTNHHQKDLRTCLARYQESEASSHDNIFYTLMQLLGIHSTVTAPELNMLQRCSMVS